MLIYLAEHIQILNGQSLGQKCGPDTEAKVSLNTAGNHRKSILNRKYLSLSNTVPENNYKREVMQRCGQKRAVLFKNAYREAYLQQCCKIGEGAFGEVFLHKNPNGKNEENTVLKIIPIEGKELINGEIQKTYEQILQEIVISMELCTLNNKNHNTNFTPGFVNLKKVWGKLTITIAK